MSKFDTVFNKNAVNYSLLLDRINGNEKIAAEGYIEDDVFLGKYRLLQIIE